MLDPPAFSPIYSSWKELSGAGRLVHKDMLKKCRDSLLWECKEKSPARRNPLARLPGCLSSGAEGLTTLPWRQIIRITSSHTFLDTDNGDDRSESILAENHVDGTPGILSGAGGRKPIKTGMKELAVMREKVNEQQRQMGKVSKAHHNHEDSKKSRLSTGRTPCQQELDQVLERISTMRLPDERGPLEHLYSLHIPNCDKHGLYNLKQCKMSVNGQRGECWCVDPIHGKVIQGAPTIRGDPECHLFYTAHEQEDRGAHALRSQ
nr:insulin-like growth factor-binding protein 2 isoform X1 [Columba livia]